MTTPTPPEGKVLWDALPAEVRTQFIAIEAAEHAQGMAKAAEIRDRVGMDDLRGYTDAVVTEIAPMPGGDIPGDRMRTFLREHTALDGQQVEAVVTFRLRERMSAGMKEVTGMIMEGLRDKRVSPGEARALLEMMAQLFDHVGQEAATARAMRQTQREAGARGESPLDAILRQGKGGRGDDDPKGRS